MKIKKLPLLLCALFCAIFFAACSNSSGSEQSLLNGPAGTPNGTDQTGTSPDGTNQTGTGDGQTQNTASSDYYTKIDTITINGTQYDLVTFGSWPQTIKASNVDVDKQCESKTVGDFTYYKGSDGEWYAEIKENALETGLRYSNSTLVATSSENRYKWFMVKPIKWRVLTTNYGGKKLLLAENVLIGKRYAASSNNYQNSEIRKWLNSNANSEAVSDHSGSGGFLKTAFTAAEIASIAGTSVDNSALSTNPDENAMLWNNGINPYASDTSTTDKIFLLSEREVTTIAYGFDVYNAYGTDNKRIRLLTDYAKASGAFQDVHVTEGMGGWWWLRSPAYKLASSARFVINLGEAFSTTNSVDSNYGGVVPALCVKNSP